VAHLRVHRDVVSPVHGDSVPETPGGVKPDALVWSPRKTLELVIGEGMGYPKPVAAVNCRRRVFLPVPRLWFRGIGGSGLPRRARSDRGRVLGHPRGNESPTLGVLSVRIAAWSLSARGAGGGVSG
jgi:hypothetical protein